MTIAAIIASSLDAALAQVPGLPHGLTAAAANNAATLLRGDIVTTLVEVARSTGAGEVSITIRPSGHYSVRVIANTASAAGDIAALLGMGAPTIVHNGDRQWSVSESGDWEAGDYVAVLGPSSPLCQCHGIERAA
jgi:hypothetical protein